MTTRLLGKNKQPSNTSGSKKAVCSNGVSQSCGAGIVTLQRKSRVAIGVTVSTAARNMSRLAAIAHGVSERLTHDSA